MTSINATKPGAAHGLALIRRFRALRCGSGYVAMDGDHEILTLTRCANGVIYAHDCDGRYNALADAINRAEIPFDAIVCSGEVEPAPSGDYEVVR